MSLDRLDLEQGSAVLTGSVGERHVAAHDFRAVLDSFNISAVDEAPMEIGDAWSELLYDLGACIDLLGITPLGLRYTCIRRVDAGSARVSLATDMSVFEFDVTLDDDDPPIGLPETLHGWAYKHPHGLADPVTI